MDPIQQAFADARHSFRAKVKDPDIYKQILATKDIDEVYKTTLKIQEEANGQSRRLAKIRPFLERLSKYAGVIETFVQAKPEILALIWGPLKLLLLWSSQMTTALDKLTSIIVDLGHALPQAELMGELYGANDNIKAVLGLFFEDILDFYRVNFDFFRKTRWKQLIDSIWDIHLRKIDVVVDNLKKHSTFLKDEVTLLDIKEARRHRIKSLDLLDETQKSQQREKFRGLRGRFAVSLYDDRLDWIRNRSVPGCGNWLLDDTTFYNWQDISNTGQQTTAWLWLQGIPGAGKTYLCGSVIDHLRKDKNRNTLFALLSYTNTNQTAIGVLQSFLFQAAEDDTDFQSVLMDATERELRGNTGYVVEMFKNWLRTADATYVVIDGLDEMERSERQILLQRLEEISKGCDELRLLVCSRSESDISRVLDEKAIGIPINRRNSGSIQIYINSRIDDLINKNKFDPKTEHELRELLSPLSAKANGMFLFARIILDSVEDSSIDEIRSELRALPNDLDDAYQRIFQRINALPAPRREKPRKVLGWIGCAPIPMTIFEMDQALSVDPHGKKMSSHVVSHDYVKMCGPFVEIVDSRLQFVHFTARDYIFSQPIADSIDKGEAMQDLVGVFLAYLASGILDADLDDEQISGDIMCGRYRLLQYAHFYFPTLLQGLNSIRPDSCLVGGLLCRLAHQCRNDEFQAVAESRDPPYANDYFEREWSDGYECARQTFQFHLAEKRWGWKLSNSESWVNFDPLITSKMLVRIQDLYDKLVHSTDIDMCTTLESHYGHRLYKCTYLFCTSSRQGFETRDDRDTHITYHEKPCKCPVPDCIYFTLGFNTQRRCDEHLAKFHSSKFSLDDLGNLNVEEAQPLLFILILDGDIESIRRLMSSNAGKKLKPEVVASARLHAADQGSLVLTKLLAPPGETDVPFAIVRAAVMSQDTEYVEWAVSRAFAWSYPKYRTKLTKVMLGVRSEEIYKIWERYVVDNAKREKKKGDAGNSGLSPPNPDKGGVIDEIFQRQVFSDIKGSTSKEIRLQHTLEKLRDYIDPYTLGAILVRVAQSQNCTLPLVKQLVQYGAPIDHPRHTFGPSGLSRMGGTGQTALHAAAKKTSKDAALVMQFLMSMGANDFDMRMEEQPGPKAIQRHLGITWRDLVTQSEWRRESDPVQPEWGEDHHPLLLPADAP